MGPRRSTPKPRSTPLAARTRPKLGYCRQCFAPVFACTFDALPLTLDPYPLTPKGELWSWYLGHKSFFICNQIVWRRTTWAIETSPTGLGGHIVRTHQCGSFIPTGELILSMKDKYERPDF